jgi:hypothetical protein|tara:strand:- start:2807 stop:3139 length:333 start_codon:yes stop_codon:yes gene_type:complete
MSDRRVLNTDSASGITTNFIYEDANTGRDSDDKIVIEHTQDVTQIIESNRRQLNMVDKHAKYGEWSKVASIPLTIYYDLKTRGILDDPKRMKKWLNSPDNRYFRTRGGQV